MNYGLAKELKEAGFPQKVGNIVPDENHQPKWIPAKPEEINPKYVRIPTLSELIDACEPDFAFLGISKRRGGRWIAGKSTENQHSLDESRYQDTPEEAVANLWLILNKK